MSLGNREEACRFTQFPQPARIGSFAKAPNRAADTLEFCTVNNSTQPTAPSRRARGSSAHLSLQEEQDLVVRLKAGDKQALTDLLLAHRPMLLAMAIRHARPSLPIEDLLQEGFAGLTEAAGRFVSDGRGRFGTCGKHWARKRILLAVKNQSLTIRVPVKRWDQKRWDLFPHVVQGYPAGLVADRRKEVWS